MLLELRSLPYHFSAFKETMCKLKQFDLLFQLNVTAAEYWERNLTDSPNFPAFSFPKTLADLLSYPVLPGTTIFIPPKTKGIEFLMLRKLQATFY